MFVDFVIDNQVQDGTLSQQLGIPQQMRFDPGLFRPYLNENNVPCVTIQTGRIVWNEAKKRHQPQLKTFAIRDLQRRGIDIPIFNTTTSLRKEDWIEIDRRVVEVSRPRLRFFNEVARRASYGGFNAFGKMTLEYQAVSDPGEALISMDGLAEGRNDRPRNNIRSIPLPIIHSDAQMSSRVLANSRNSGVGLDTTMITACTRRVAEMVERLAIGTETGPEWGTVSTGPFPHEGLSKIYGITTYPYRLTKTDLSNPSSGWTPDDTVTDVLEMRSQMYGANMYGPYMIFHSTDWDAYLDADYYSAASGTGGVVASSQTLRQRLLRIGSEQNPEGGGQIMGVMRLDYLDEATNPFTMIMVQLTEDVIEAVNGMRPTVFQWTEKGGFDLRFKVAAIQVIRLKHDYTGQCGVLHATVP